MTHRARTITLDNAGLAGLLNNSAARAAFPLLNVARKKLSAATKGCGSCGRQKAKARDKVLGGLKTAIGGWPQAQKEALKKLLQVDKVRLVVNKTMTEF